MIKLSREDSWVAYVLFLRNRKQFLRSVYVYVVFWTFLIFGLAVFWIFLLIFCFSLLNYTYYYNYRSHISLQVAKLAKSARAQILIFPTVCLRTFRIDSTANGFRSAERRVG